MAEEREQRSSAPAHATGAVQFVAVDDVAADETFRLRPDGDVSLLATSLGRLGQLTPVELRPWPGAGSDGPRWQVVAGFRRMAALRLLARDRVLARLHDELAEDDAWGLALGEALLHQPLTGDELAALRDRLRERGVAPWAAELVEEALVSAPIAAELREKFYDFLTRVEPASPLSREAGEGGGDGPGSDPGRGPAPSPGPSAPAPSPAGGEAVVREAPVEAGSDDVIEVTAEDLVQDLAIRLSALNQDLATAVEAWEDLPPEGRKLLVEQARYVAALLPFMEVGE